MPQRVQGLYADKYGIPGPPITPDVLARQQFMRSWAPQMIRLRAKRDPTLQSIRVAGELQGLYKQAGLETSPEELMEYARNTLTGRDLGPEPGTRAYRGEAKYGRRNALERQGAREKFRMRAQTRAAMEQAVDAGDVGTVRRVLDRQDIEFDGGWKVGGQPVATDHVRGLVTQKAGALAAHALAGRSEERVGAEARRLPLPRGRVPPVADKWDVRGAALLNETTGEIRPLPYTDEQLQRIAQIARAQKGERGAITGYTTHGGVAYQTTIDKDTGTVSMTPIPNVPEIADAQVIERTDQKGVSHTSILDKRTGNVMPVEQLTVQGAVPGADYIHKSLGKTQDGRWAVYTLRQDPDGQVVDDIQHMPEGWKPTAEWEKEQTKTPSRFWSAWDYVYELDAEGKPVRDETGNAVPRIGPDGQPVRRLRTVEQKVDARGRALGQPTMRVPQETAEAPAEEPPSPEEAYVDQLEQQMKALKPAADAGNPKAKADLERLLTIYKGIRESGGT